MAERCKKCPNPTKPGRSYCDKCNAADDAEKRRKRVAALEAEREWNRMFSIGNKGA